MTVRRRLPDRRLAESFDIEVAGLSYRQSMPSEDGNECREYGLSRPHFEARRLDQWRKSRRIQTRRKQRSSSWT
jgi:hypothetical protein